MSLEGEDVELLPCADIVLSDIVLVEIFVVVYAAVSRNLYLRIGTGNEVHVLAWGQGHLEFLDE